MSASSRRRGPAASRRPGPLLCTAALACALLLPATGVGALTGPTPPGGDLPAAGGGTGRPVPQLARNWPVGLRPPVLRGWHPPASEYGAGHRGVDLGAPAGAPVRAVAAGRVVFVGQVAGRGVLTLELAESGSPPLRTTYEPISSTLRVGARVEAGRPLGVLTARAGHCGAEPCLHWGLRRGRAYLDPLLLLPPELRGGGRIRLYPPRPR